MTPLETTQIDDVSTWLPPSLRNLFFDIFNQISEKNPGHEWQFITSGGTAKTRPEVFVRPIILILKTMLPTKPSKRIYPTYPKYPSVCTYSFC